MRSTSTRSCWMLNAGRSRSSFPTTDLKLIGSGTSWPRATFAWQERGSLSGRTRVMSASALCALPIPHSLPVSLVSASLYTQSEHPLLITLGFLI